MSNSCPSMMITKIANLIDFRFPLTFKEVFRSNAGTSCPACQITGPECRAHGLHNEVFSGIRLLPAIASRGRLLSMTAIFPLARELMTLWADPNVNFTRYNLLDVEAAIQRSRLPYPEIAFSLIKHVACMMCGPDRKQTNASTTKPKTRVSTLSNWGGFRHD